MTDEDRLLQRAAGAPDHDPCVLYPPSELAKYWYGPLMGLASAIRQLARSPGGIVFFPILMLAGFSPSEAVAYAAATQMIGVGLFVPGSFIVYEPTPYFFGDPEWYVLLIFTISISRSASSAASSGFIGIGIEMLYMLLTMHPRRVEVDTTQAGVSCITVAGRVSNHIFDPTSIRNVLIFFVAFLCLEVVYNFCVLTELPIFDSISSLNR
ncbi:hypothetical protein JL721_5059 [Aureococcus anophagefferens]|nr:hypothetical protein JL721_5059 [Aureococcus anophagefferens]